MSKKIIENNVENLFEDYDSQKVEDFSKIEVVSSGNLSEAVEEYSSFLDLDNTAMNTIPIDTVLTPSEINQFIGISKMCLDHFQYYTNTGDYISRLIQNSYLEGEKYFHVKSDSLTSFRNFGKKIRANDNEIVNFIIEGNLGENSFCYSKNIFAKITGDVDQWFGNGSLNLQTEIVGNVGHGFYKISTDGITKVIGEISSNCGDYAQNLDLTIDGTCNPSMHNLFCSMRNSKLRFYDLKELQKTLKALPKKNVVKNPLIYWTSKSLIDYNSLIYMRNEDHEKIIARFRPILNGFK